jgi:phosphoserine phosphatase RsbU/P
VFVTAAFGVLNMHSLEVAIAIAGHPDPMVCGRPELVPHDQRNPPLAVVEGERYDVWRFSMEPGDALVMFSDGICEARSGTAMFGMERVRRVLNTCGGQTGQQVADTLLGEVQRHSGGDLRDDVAVLVLRPRAWM